LHPVIDGACLIGGSVGGLKISMVPARAPKIYSILVAHPLTLVREGLAALCQAQPQYCVLTQCANGTIAQRLIEAEKPDIAVLDLNLPDVVTLDIVRKLRLAKVLTRMIVLSIREDRKTLMEALRAGVNAFLLKSDSGDHLLEAFERTLDGWIYISPSLDLDMIFGSGQKSASEGDPFQTLSAREYQVFCLLVEGTRAKEIGARLGLNPKTIDTYRVNLMRKLDIYTVAGLVRYAMCRDKLSA